MASGYSATTTSSSLDTYIVDRVPFDKLPREVRQRLGNSRESYDAAILEYSIHHQLAWETVGADTTVLQEKVYYEDLLRHSRSCLSVYPYHLQHVLVRLLRTTPFDYYVSVLLDIIKAEKSYDSLPNFTAQDALRMLGIGRNQYIDIMNVCRSRGWLWRTNVITKTIGRWRSPIHELLPSEPVPNRIEHWWTVHVGYVTENDARMCSEPERLTLEFLRNLPDGCAAAVIPFQVLHSLHSKGLVFLEVPIADDDFLSVLPLEHFVMNRTQSTDPLETLLYQVFVAADERTHAKDLATVLQVPVPRLLNAFSLIIRLGLGAKKNAPSLEALDPHPTWLEEVERDSDGFSLIGSRTGDSGKGTPSVSGKRVALLFDASLAGMLMMGNLSQGLKVHAVTLFEVGKLTDESLGDFLTELDQVNPISEGEAKRYFDHAIALRQTLRFLRNNSDCHGAPLDMIRCESINALDPSTRARILHKNYSVLVSIAPVAPETLSVTSTEPRHHGSMCPEADLPWFRFFIYSVAQSGPPSILFPRGRRIERVPSLLKNAKTLTVSSWCHAGNEVSATNLLPILNESLLTSPCLVQDAPDESASTDGQIVYIPFPFEDDGSGDSSEPPPLPLQARDLARHPAIKRLAVALRLHTTFGYVSMLHIPEKVGTMDEYVVLELHFGVPLFDPVLNALVCALASKHRLLHEDTFREANIAARELTISLFDFIVEHSRCPSAPSSLAASLTSSAVGPGWLNPLAPPQGDVLLVTTASLANMASREDRAGAERVKVEDGEAGWGSSLLTSHVYPRHVVSFDGRRVHVTANVM